jgi:hypothetical protein
MVLTGDAAEMSTNCTGDASIPGNRIAFGVVKRVNNNEFSALETLVAAM